MHFERESNSEARELGCTSAMHADRRKAFVAAREQWPTVSVRFDQFCAHLNRLGYQQDLPNHPSSLYLCIGCALGIESACRILEDRHFPSLWACIAKLDARPDVIEDVLQQVRQRLLVGPTPRIVSYRGEGALGAWLGTVAKNVARDLLRGFGIRREQRACGSDGCLTSEARLDFTAPSSPEDDAFREQCAPILQQALSTSLLALESEQRALLSHYFVSGLGIDSLGALYSVNRSTAARRVLRAVQRIRSLLHRELVPHFGPLTPGELESWFPLLSQQLNVDAAALLGEQ